MGGWLAKHFWFVDFCNGESLKNSILHPCFEKKKSKLFCLCCCGWNAKKGVVLLSRERRGEGWGRLETGKVLKKKIVKKNRMCCMLGESLSFLYNDIIKLLGFIRVR